MPRSSAARSTSRSTTPRRSPRTPSKATASKTVARKATATKATTKGTTKTATRAPRPTKSTPTTKRTASQQTGTPSGASLAATVAKQTAKTSKQPTPTPEKRITPQPAQHFPAATLTDEELTAIWKTYKRTHDQNLRNILVEHHMQLVRMIAERVLQTLPKSIELDDLTSAGTFGLMDAIDGFDLSRGIKFKTYCTTRIRGSILDELRSQDWVPRLVRIKAHRIEKSLRKLEGELGRLPNTVELAEAMNLSIAELQDTQDEANAKTIFSLSEKWDDGDDDKEMEKVDVLADKRSPDPHHSTAEQDVMETVTRNLTKKERLIIIMYYYEGLTMREIGEIMELTESRVCQIHSNVMARLKGQLDRVNLVAG